MQDDYTVHLQAFEGPLDLLLFLVKRAEVDIAEVEIASIADQYLEFLGDLGSVDVDDAGEFLVTAATLMEIKSRAIDRQTASPDDTAVRPESADDSDDPGVALIHALMEYQKYRHAADNLEDRAELWSQRAPVGKVPSPKVQTDDEPLGIDTEDLGVLDLFEAFARISSTVNFDRLGEHEVISDDTPIEIHAEDIMERLTAQAAAAGASGGGAMTMREIFQGRNRAEMIGLFLALLGLVRDQRVGVSMQDGEIGIFARTEVEDIEDAAD